MTTHRVRLALLQLGLLAALGCDPNLAVPPGNRQPMADARVMGMEGKNVTVDFTGQPVKVTLDGSFSTDPDGKIVTYRWLSARKVAGSAPAAGSGGSAAGSSGGAAGQAGQKDDSDGGTAGSGGAGGGAAGGGGGIPNMELRWVPPGAPPDWPDDTMQPVVELPEGDFAFSLWVIDDRSVVSQPSIIHVSVRTALPPEVQACVDTVVDTVPLACKTCVCGLSDMCRMAANKTVCDATCWGLLSCIGSKCAATPTDTSCITANCGTQLGGATGARMIGSCVTMCPTQCRGM